ncbi:MAG: alcohol dehydrogenase catalytic domain-containing protein [Saprospiraceae bacterium]|nr:alcohol dehydrogenase catalytic domain-containing protein [Saprospiraceae bacterium]
MTSEKISGQAIIADGSGGHTLETIIINPPRKDEVLVQIKASGICHTDYDSINHWPGPFVAGHEGAGIVLDHGPEVKNLKIGDHVILNWAIPCGKCFQCQIGQTNICEINSPVIHHAKFNPGHVPLERTQYAGKGILRSFNLGTMSTHTVVREAAAIRIDPDVPFDSACIIGCGVMTGVGSVWNSAKVTADSSVVVIGAGGVGLNIIQGAKIAGAKEIIVLEISRHRLQLAQSFGATHLIEVEKEDKKLTRAKSEVWKITSRGADFAFECTGIPELGDAPLRMVRNAGVAIQVSGIEQEINIDMNLFEWDKTYLNPLYGKCNPSVDFPKIIKYYKSGSLKLDELISKKYHPHQLSEAFEDMLQGRIAKGVIIFD